MSSIFPNGHASAIPDRYLWLGLAAFAFLAARGIRAAITESTRRAEVREAWKKNTEEGLHSNAQDGRANGIAFDGGGGAQGGSVQSRSQPEDSISISTLHTLVRSPNPSIALAAQSLLCNRLNAEPSGTATWLAADLRSSDERTVQQAKYAVDWLLESGLAPDVLSALHATGAWRNTGCGWEGGMSGDGFPMDDTYVRENNILAARNMRAYGEENFFRGADGGGAGRRASSLIGMEESQRRRRMIEEANRAIDENANAARRRARREAVVVGNGAAENAGGEVDGEDGGTVPHGWWVA